MTRRLIEEKGFRAVALEADWPDAFRVHRFVTGDGEDNTGTEALGGFRRFPAWMWRNTVVLEFVDRLRRRNGRLASRNARAGIYGMDLYSLHGSIEAVLDYLDKVNRLAARQARARYGCFEHFSEDPQAYQAV